MQVGYGDRLTFDVGTVEAGYQTQWGDCYDCQPAVFKTVNELADFSRTGNSAELGDTAMDKVSVIHKSKGQPAAFMGVASCS